MWFDNHIKSLGDGYTAAVGSSLVVDVLRHFAARRGPTVDTLAHHGDGARRRQNKKKILI